MSEITLYTIRKCPKCAVLKQLLDRANIEYELFDDVEKMIAMGMTSAPMLNVDGKLMDYKDAIKWAGTIPA